MSKSKRDPVVTLSKKKGMDHKENIVTSFENMRNPKFKQLGEQLKSTSRCLIMFHFIKFIG
uniref:Uncharacterized protein n=1 Tax=Helianthus annuus TaxID=4232 RepID=A0A251UQK8_HELAN